MCICNNSDCNGRFQNQDRPLGTKKAHEWGLFFEMEKMHIGFAILMVSVSLFLWLVLTKCSDVKCIRNMVLSSGYMYFQIGSPKELVKNFYGKNIPWSHLLLRISRNNWGEEEELYCTGEGKVSLKNFSTNNIVRRHLLGKWWLLLPFLWCDNSKEPFRCKSQ